eukprot:5489422-Ditylum_brightwellii.AAC.1
MVDTKVHARVGVSIDDICSILQESMDQYTKKVDGRIEAQEQQVEKHLNNMLLNFKLNHLQGSNVVNIYSQQQDPHQVQQSTFNFHHQPQGFSPTTLFTKNMGSGGYPVMSSSTASTTSLSSRLSSANSAHTSAGTCTK